VYQSPYYEGPLLCGFNVTVKGLMLTDDADYFVNVAADALCYVNVNSTSLPEEGPCDALSVSSTTQSVVVVVQLRRPAMIAFGRLRVESCPNQDELRLHLQLVTDGRGARNHTVRNQTFF